MTTQYHIFVELQDGLDEWVSPVAYVTYDETGDREEAIDAVLGGVDLLAKDGPAFLRPYWSGWADALFETTAPDEPLVMRATHGEKMLTVRVQPVGSSAR